MDSKEEFFMEEPIKINVTEDNHNAASHNQTVKIKVTEDAGTGRFDAPFEDVTSSDFPDSTTAHRSGVSNLLEQAARLSFNLMSVPLNLLPSKSRYHAKNSIREGVLSFKVLVDDVTEALDRNLSQSMERDRANQPRPAFDNEIPPAQTASETLVEEVGDDKRAI